MTNNLILNKYKRYFQINDMKYKLGLITKKYVFYYVVGGQDVAMFDRNMKLLSLSNMAQDEYTNQLKELYLTKDWVWADNMTKYNAKQIYEEYYHYNKLNKNQIKLGYIYEKDGLLYKLVETNSNSVWIYNENRELLEIPREVFKNVYKLYDTNYSYDKYSNKK